MRGVQRREGWFVWEKGGGCLLRTDDKDDWVCSREGGFFSALFQPVFGLRPVAVLDSLRAAASYRLLVPSQLLERGEHGPNLPLPVCLLGKPDDTAAGSDLGRHLDEELDALGIAIIIELVDARSREFRSLINLDGNKVRELLL